MDDVRLIQGDCLDVLRSLDQGSVNCVVADPPYGQSACEWDWPIPLPGLWRLLRRVVTPGGVIALTAMQPFTSELVLSNRKGFRYCMVWEKPNATGFFDANRRPLRAHEDVVIFSNGPKPKYRPQMGTGPRYKTRRTARLVATLAERRQSVLAWNTDNEGTRYPRSVVRFAHDRGLHPTQKPVALMEYLVRTYTDEGDTVLDFCMGSGTTGVACVQAGRNFIGVEISTEYHAIAEKRIAEAQAALMPARQEVARVA